MSETARSPFKTLLIVIAALLVLAFAGMWAVGWFEEAPVEVPLAPQEVASYPLIEQEGCRIERGICVLSNERMRLAVGITQSNRLQVRASVPLESLLVGLKSLPDRQPVPAAAIDDQRQRWILQMSGRPASDDAIRFVAITETASYFGEASLTFLAAPQASQP